MEYYEEDYTVIKGSLFRKNLRKMCSQKKTTEKKSQPKEKKENKKIIIFDISKNKLTVNDLMIYNNCYSKNNHVHNYNIKSPNVKSSMINTKVSEESNKILKKENANYMNELIEEFSIEKNFENLSHYQKITKEIEVKLERFVNNAKQLKNNDKPLDIILLIHNNYSLTSSSICLPYSNITHNYFLYQISLNHFDFSQLIYLNLSHNPLRDTGGCFLLHLIKVFGAQLTTLNLKETFIGKFSIEILCEILGNNFTPLSSLNISSNNLNDNLFNDLFVAISKNKSLNEFYYSNNNLGYLGSLMLSNALLLDKKIKILDLSKNPLINVSLIAKGLCKNRSIEYLLLNDIELENKTFIDDFYNSLLENKSLVLLSLMRNKLNNKILSSISTILAQSTISYMLLSGNYFTLSKLIKEKIYKVITSEEFVFDSLNESKFSLTPLQLYDLIISS